MNGKWFVIGLLTGVLILAACMPATVPASSREQNTPISVVATTSIVGDVVRQVGGNLVSVTVLLPTGSDPHSYQPAPQDVAKISEATLVFANGAGLEEFLQNLIENAGATDRLVKVSEGIELKDFGANADEHENGDPHTWVDPNNVMIWVENIRSNLNQIDPTNANTYQANADHYLTELKELDTWIRNQVDQIPPENRKLVTDHMVFGYFADRYGFEQIGAVIPGYSTLASPSAQDIVAIEDAIQNFSVKAIFVGKTINPTIAQRIAEDTGVKLVFLYHGSLSEASGPAASYLDYMRYNVTEIVNALK